MSRLQEPQNYRYGYSRADEGSRSSLEFAHSEDGSFLDANEHYSQQGTPVRATVPLAQGANANGNSNNGHNTQPAAYPGTAPTRTSSTKHGNKYGALTAALGGLPGSSDAPPAGGASGQRSPQSAPGKARRVSGAASGQAAASYYENAPATSQRASRQRGSGGGVSEQGSSAHSYAYSHSPRSSNGNGAGQHQSPAPAYSSAFSPPAANAGHPLMSPTSPLSPLSPPAESALLLPPRPGSGLTTPTSPMATGPFSPALSHSASSPRLDNRKSSGALSKMSRRSTAAESGQRTPGGGEYDATSPSLVSHYLPGKVGRIHRQGSRRHRGASPYLDQQPSNSAYFTSDDLAAATRANHSATSGAGAFRRKPKSYTNSPLNGSKLELPLHSNGGGSGANTPPHSPGPLRSAPALAASAMPRPTKFGAGRAAWGPNGGGNPALGAGDFEDDDGIDLVGGGGDGDADGRRGSAAEMSSAAAYRSNPKRRSMLSGNNAASAANGNTGLGLTSGAAGASDDIAQTTGGGMRRRGRALDAEERIDGSQSSSESSHNRMHGRRGRHDDEYGDAHYTARAVVGSGLFGRLFAGFFLRKGNKGTGVGRLRWNKFKWALFIANFVLTLYAVAGLVGTLLTWANVWENSDVVRAANSIELILATVAAALMVVTAIIGWCGILLNNRAFLTFYNVFLWASFAFLVAPGYIAYKKRTFNLEGKVNYMWSRDLNTNERRVVQNSLSCCGFYNPFIEAAESSRCYARSTLPGCKGRFVRFERMALKLFYECAFGLVGPHLIIIVTALLSSNHVTYRFGKGLTPKAYRLDEATARSIKEDFLAQLQSMYGPNIITEMMANRRRRMSQRASLERVHSASHLLATPVSAHEQLAPPDKGALFKQRHGSFSSLGSEKGSPLHQSLGVQELGHDGLDADSSDHSHEPLDLKR